MISTEVDKGKLAPLLGLPSSYLFVQLIAGLNQLGLASGKDFLKLFSEIAMSH
jgi:hypothetical protein